MQTKLAHTDSNAVVDYHLAWNGRPGGGGGGGGGGILLHEATQLASVLSVSSDVTPSRPYRRRYTCTSTSMPWGPGYCCW